MSFKFTPKVGDGKSVIKNNLKLSQFRSIIVWLTEMNSGILGLIYVHP